MKKLKRGKSQKLYDDAKKIIPGGTQLLSKRPELFLPDYWPAYYKKAKGIKVWDLDSKVYKDFSTNGIGASILGYQDLNVDKEVVKAINNGSMSSLNSYEEVDLASLLIDIHPWAEMARFSKTGGEACAIGVRIARAATKKNIVLFSGYHGWHDWYLSANLSNPKNLNKQLLSGLSPIGVPNNLVNSSYPFIFNDVDSLNDSFKLFSGDIAAVIMEPMRGVPPSKQFLKTLKKNIKKEDCALIIDEVTSGFRETLGGLHLKMDLEPDICILGKGLGNGYPISAIIGKSKYMNAAQETFISSTFFTERIGFVAALETLKQMKKRDVQKKLISVGQTIKTSWKEIAENEGIEINVSGLDPLASFSFVRDDQELECMTFFIQEMLRDGFLAGSSYYVSYAVSDRDIEEYLISFKKILKKISSIKDFNDYLVGGVKHSTFQRLN